MRVLQFRIKITNNQEKKSKPLVVNVRPEDKSETNNPRPVIYGEFIPSQGNSIQTESFEIKLDDVDILSICTLTAEKFSCSLDRDLSVGKHKINVKIKDSGINKPSKNGPLILQL